MHKRLENTMTGLHYSRQAFHGRRGVAAIATLHNCECQSNERMPAMQPASQGWLLLTTACLPTPPPHPALAPPT